jgi:hypothetical protein
MVTSALVEGGCPRQAGGRSAAKDNGGETWIEKRCFCQTNPSWDSLKWIEPN